MANDKITMLKLKRLLQLLSAGQSQNCICKELGMSKTTVSRYGKASQQIGLTYQELLHLKESDLESLLQPKSPTPHPDSRKADLDQLMEEYIRELSRPYVTVQLLWEEYISKNPDGYQYTQFKKYLNEYQRSHSYAYHKTYIPGKEWQIDFAGDPLYLTDPSSGCHTKVVLLCCIMPYSGYAYCRALPDATMENFFYGLTLGIEYLGAVPQIAKSDNMKQWVKHTNRYEPKFTEETERWCLHYGIITALSSIFASHRSKIVVKLTSRKTVNLCGVEIGDGLFDGFSTWKELHAVYEEMKSLLSEKYGEPDSFYTIEEFERNSVKESEKLNEIKMDRCIYFMVFPIRGKIDSNSLTMDGTVIGSVQLTLTSKGCVQITYSGFKNSEEVKKYNLEDV